MSFLISGIYDNGFSGLIFKIFAENLRELKAFLLQTNLFLKNNTGSGQVAQLVRAPSPRAEVAGLIPGQGTYKNQAVGEPRWQRR